ncbi:YqaA family protein [Halocatena pleomorpha]|uniref:YqaA family protein n=1 Tax=Halocatena pleomorpha TaxID=1785090 RepID=UPI001F1CF95C|nr:VTT domain-containing protein [Halocatena pleomorpha]
MIPELADPLSPLFPLLVENGSWELKRAVKHAVGPFGLILIFIYSFLIAVVLPFPSEVVLAAPLNLGVPEWITMALIVVVSSIGKALGSVFALTIGDKTIHSGPVIRAVERTGIDIVRISQRKTVQIAQQYGYLGLAAALCVPGFPDTLSIYAFTVIEQNYLKFAAATFIGSVGRLVIWLAGIEIVFLVF